MRPTKDASEKLGFEHDLVPRENLGYSKQPLEQNPRGLKRDTTHEVCGSETASCQLCRLRISLGLQEGTKMKAAVVVGRLRQAWLFLSGAFLSDTVGKSRMASCRCGLLEAFLSAYLANFRIMYVSPDGCVVQRALP